jgi:ribosomal protein L3
METQRQLAALFERKSESLTQEAVELKTYTVELEDRAAEFDARYRELEGKMQTFKVCGELIDVIDCGRGKGSSNSKAE